MLIGAQAGMGAPETAALWRVYAAAVVRPGLVLDAGLAGTIDASAATLGLHAHVGARALAPLRGPRTS